LYILGWINVTGIQGY